MNEPDPVHVAVLALRAHGHVTCAEALEEYAATSRAECERLTAELQDWKDGASAEAKSGDEARATLAEREAQLAAMTEDRDLWRSHNEDGGDCPIEERLREREAEMASIQATYDRMAREWNGLLRERDEARAALATLEQRKLEHIIEAVKDATARARKEALEEASAKVKALADSAWGRVNRTEDRDEEIRAEAYDFAAQEVRALASDTTKGET